MSNVVNLLDQLEKQELERLEKIKELKLNKGAIEYFQCGSDGGRWLPLTEEVAGKDWDFRLQDLRINLFFLVKTDDGRYFGFPFIRGDVYLQTYIGPIVRQDWLDELGLEAPCRWLELLVGSNQHSKT